VGVGEGDEEGVATGGPPIEVEEDLELVVGSAAPSCVGLAGVDEGSLGGSALPYHINRVVGEGVEELSGTVGGQRELARRTVDVAYLPEDLIAAQLIQFEASPQHRQAH